ncbi:type-F conjugative transfer system secretin TraK [Klebsiella aerogenes]
MNNANPLYVAGCLSLSLMSPAISTASNGILTPVVVPLGNYSQANILLSNTDPNLFTVAGDRITAINGLDGDLTNQEQTDNGSVILATMSKKPFTFIVETQRGMNFSVRAVPRAGTGRTIQVVPEHMSAPGPAKFWEESLPYERLLVALNRALRKGEMPSGYQSVPVTSEILSVAGSMRAKAEKVWTGYHLKVVRYIVENMTYSPVIVKESDFWQPGTRAIMMNGISRSLVGGGRLQVWITTTEGER